MENNSLGLKISKLINSSFSTIPSVFVLIQSDGSQSTKEAKMKLDILCNPLSSQNVTPKRCYNCGAAQQIEKRNN